MTPLSEAIAAAATFDDHVAETASNTHEGRWLSDAGIAEVDGARKENARLAPLIAALGAVAVAADEAVDWLCDHVGAHPTAGERKWCDQCHNWVHPKDKDLRDRVFAALARLRDVVGDGK